MSAVRKTHLGALADGALVGGLLGLTFLLGCSQIRDMDIWWHLKAGQAILNGHGLPTQDTYTFAAAGHEWIDLHWLFQAAVAWMHNLGGMRLLTLAAASAAVLAVGIGVWGTASFGSSAWVIPSWLLAVVVMSDRFVPRPEMATLVCLAGDLCVLRAGERNPRLLWLLTPIQLLWVNVQGLFILGPFLFVCWLLEGFVQRGKRRDRTFCRHATAAAVGVLLACFANPYGWRGALYPLALAKTMFVDGPLYSKHIGELAPTLTVLRQSANRSPYVWAAILLFVTVLATFYWTSRRLSFFRVSIVTVFSALALTAVRNLPQFAMVAGMVAAWNIGDVFQGAAAAQRSRWAFRARGLSAAVFLVLFVWVGSGGFYQYSGGGRRLGLGEHPYWHAHEAVEFAARDGMPQHILAFHEGQAALMEFSMRPDQRVYADPRTEVMGREVMTRYYGLAKAIASHAEGWQDLLRALPGPLSILVNHQTHYLLEATILTDPQWKCVWFDPIAAVYVPASLSEVQQDRSGDFSRRHFGSPARDARDARANKAAIDPAAVSLEVQSLLQVALSFGDRSTESGGVDRRLLLLNAMRLSREGWDQFGESVAGLNALARASFHLYGYPARSPSEWRLLEILGVARSRWLLRRVRERHTPDFDSLLNEFTVAQALGDLEAAHRIGALLTEMTPATEQQSRWRDIIRRTLAAGPGRLGVDTLSVIAGDVRQQEELVKLLFAARRFQQLEQLASSLFEMPHAADPSQLSKDACDQIATACLLSGNPEQARLIWNRMPAGDANGAHADTRLGLTFLVEQQYDRALMLFEQAAREGSECADARCGQAIGHLELGHAEEVVAACDGVLNLENPPEGLREFCERLQTFANRHLSSGPGLNERSRSSVSEPTGP